jgi:hypothetical protein
MAALAPMPSASDATATRVTNGVFQTMRKASPTLIMETGSVRVSDLDAYNGGKVARTNAGPDLGLIRWQRERTQWTD